MRYSDFIEAISVANQIYKEKHGKEMEIFDFCFSEDGYDGDMYIQAVSEVKYENAFGFGTRIGLKPHEDIRIHFEVEDLKIVDRSVTFDEAP